MANKPKFGNSKPENFVTKFLQHAANYGFQRPNRYIVLVHGPGIQFFSSPITGGNTGKLDLSSGVGLYPEQKKRLAINCVSTTLSGKKLDTDRVNHIGSGPAIYFPTNEDYDNNLTLEFRCSTDMFESKYFTAWNNRVIDPVTHEGQMYEDYAKKWKILVVMLPPDIGSFDNIAPAFANNSETSYIVAAEGIDREDSKALVHNLYFRRYCECYPVEIATQQISTGTTDDIMSVTVRFHYRYWDDPVSIYMENIQRQYDRQDFKEQPLSPFEQFKKILRDIARYSNPNELRQLLIDKGFDVLNQTFGTINVERVAKAGQIIDVYNKTPDKNYTVTQRKLIGPLGDII